MPIDISGYIYAPTALKSLIQRENEIHEDILKLAENDENKAILAVKIIFCESEIDNSQIHKNKNSTDYGYWQINDYYWEDYFRKKGLNIKNKDDNLKAGFEILNKYGIEMWKASKECWNKEKAGW